MSFLPAHCRTDAVGRHRAEQGFTLVEMVIAVSLVAVLFLSIAGVLNAGLRALAAAKTRAQANEIATRGIEDLQRFDFNTLGLCVGSWPSGTTPAGLSSSEMATINCSAPAAVAATTPCQDVVLGATPRSEYRCTTNNIGYLVRRYIVRDSLNTTKRLAVYVDWDDLNGKHQVSQQSSLRAPDQRAITGLEPPKFKTTPAPSAMASPSPARIDPTTRRLALGQIDLSVQTENVFGPMSTTLVGAMPTHAAGDSRDITVLSYSGFPNYNGFPITIGGETMRVIAGAGTTTWRVVPDGTSAHSSGSQVAFAGDQVYASVLTIDAAGETQTQTISLSSSDGGTTWSYPLRPVDTYRFAPGSQFFSFGILRAADGKVAATFAPDVEFCLNDGGGNCQPQTDLPAIDAVSNTSSTLTNGALNSDIIVSATTRNVTGADTVSVNFVTAAGAVGVQLDQHPLNSCPPPTVYTPNTTCSWQGRISRAAGYSFTGDPQYLYFTARQTVVANTVDVGSTASRRTAAMVTFT